MTFHSVWPLDSPETILSRFAEWGAVGVDELVPVEVAGMAGIQVDLTITEPRVLWDRTDAGYDLVPGPLRVCWKRRRAP